MQNKLICVLLSLVFFIPVMSPQAYGEELVLSAYSAIIMNCTTGEIVYQKNSREKRGIASTTKIMTSLLALESGKLQEEITVNGVDVAVEGTSIGLKEGDKITLETLVKGMLLESGNDAANVTAAFLGGGIEGFAQMMNDKARQLGMNNTHFCNPSGLTEDEHYSTAYDMALLACYAIKNPLFCNICSQSSMRVSYGNPQFERTFSNHNKLLNTAEGVFGIKTGFTKASGRCLVSAVTRNGATFVAVTLNAPDDWNDHRKMFDYAFDNLKENHISFDSSSVSIPVVGSDNERISVKLLNSLDFSSCADFQFEVNVYCEKFLYAGVKKGDIVGRVTVTDFKGDVITQSPLLSCENAPVNFEISTHKPTVTDRIKQSVQKFLKGI